MTITKTIHAKANGASPANKMTVLITWKPNDLCLVASFPNLTNSATSVITNSLETNATTTTCSDGVRTSNPSVTHSKSVLTVATSTSWTKKYVIEATVTDPSTCVDWENATSAKRKSNWTHTNVAFNVSPKRKTIPN